MQTQGCGFIEQTVSSNFTVSCEQAFGTRGEERTQKAFTSFCPLACGCTTRFNKHSQWKMTTLCPRQCDAHAQVCMYKNDEMCDEPDGFGYCPRNTDCLDCGSDCSEGYRLSEQLLTNQSFSQEFCSVASNKIVFCAELVASDASNHSDHLYVVCLS